MSTALGHVGILEGQQAVQVQSDLVAQTIGKRGIRFDIDEAREGDKKQQVDLGVYHAFRLHWKAALWSMGVSTCLVMEGYGQSDFVSRFGTFKPGSTTEKEITAPWQSGLPNSALCGEIMGLAVVGWATERFGYRRTLMAALAMMTASIFVPVFAPSLPVLSFGEVLQGIPWGMFQTLTTAFAVEICPQTLRHYLTTYVCFCWGLGIFLSSAVVRGAVNIEGSQWSWRLPFVLQWMWPIPLMLIAYFVPESPWWLVRTGQHSKAKEALRRLSPSNFYDDKGLDQQISLMIHTSALEELETEGASYIDCFRGVNLRRTTIVCVTWAFQWLCGNPLMGFAVTFYRRAGLDEIMALNFNMIMNTSYLIGTVLSWKLMDHFGRRSIYIGGGVGLCAILVVMGALGFEDGDSISWAIGSLLIVFAMYYNSSIGPVCYAIVSEIPSGRLRAKSIVLARLTYNLTGLVTNTITPRMISDTAWNWGARGAFLYLGTCALLTIWFFFYLPETRNRSFGEIDLLFEAHVPARKFPSTQVDQFGVRSRHELGGSASRVMSHSSRTDEKSLGEKSMADSTIL